MNRKLLLLSLLLSIPWLGEATERVGPHQGGGVAQVQWRKLAGHVESCDLNNRCLTLRDKNGNIASVTVDENVQIFRYWRLIAFNDVNIRDHLILKRTNTFQ